MKCSNCSHENAPDFLFCEKCGEPLRKECPECGHANALDFAFCENCGHKFAAEAAYVPASEELAQTAPPAKSPPKRKQKASIIPTSEEAVPAQEAPPPQVVVIQQEKSRGLPGWLWLVLVLIIAAIFFVIIGPRQPVSPPSVSSVGQSSGSGDTGSTGDTGSAGQSSAGSGDTGSGTQPTNTPRPPDTGSNLSPAKITVDQDTNCRYGPSSSGFDIRETIYAGETVLIIGVGTDYAEEWFLVEVNGLECWVWSGLGEASGDTAGLASINPPPVPVAEQPATEPDEDQDAKAEDGKDDGEKEEEEQQEVSREEECLALTPEVTIDPTYGPIPTVYGIQMSGFYPWDEPILNVYFESKNIFTAWFITAGASGEAYHQLVSEAGDEPGPYLVVALSAYCESVQASASYLVVE